MATNGKAKGDNFERKIAKKMTDWTGTKFERVPASGGLHWKQDNRVYGDIICNDPDFPFVIECKNREAWNMDALINGSKEVESWWKQVNRDAGETGKAPMVIFTRNRQPDYVMLRTKDFYDDELIEAQDINRFSIAVEVNDTPVVIFKLDEFTRKHFINWSHKEVTIT